MAGKVNSILMDLFTLIIDIVILPQSALMSLMTRTGSGPILFIIDNMETALTTYTSVLEFIAEEGRIYLPQWVSILQFLILWPLS